MASRIATERSLITTLAAHESWARTEDRAARTAAARAALAQRFLDECDGDPKRAENLRKAYFTRLALKSAQARRKAAREKAQTEQELDAILAAAGEL